MQFKKAQSDMVQNIIDNSDDITFCKKTKTTNGYKDFYNFLNSPGKQLIFEKRGNHRYWYLEDRQ